MTYELSERCGNPYIKCLVCGSISFSRGDVEFLYCGRCHKFHNDLMRSKVLPMWTVYDNPSDYPGKFVARMSFYDRATSNVLVADTLEELRGLLPPRLTRLERDPNDDPVIVEVWV